MQKKKPNNEPKKVSVLIEHDKPNSTNSDSEQEIAFDNDVYELIHDIDKETSESILSFYHIKLKLRNDESLDPTIAYESPQPFVAYNYILDGISALDTENPNKLHRDNVTVAIKSISKNKETQDIDLKDKNLHDILSRNQLKTLGVLHSRLKDAQPQDQTDNSCFEKDGMFLADRIFLDVLNDIGPQGKQDAKKCAPKFKTKFEDYKKGKKNLLSSWFNLDDETQEKPFHVSLAFIILTTSILRDNVQRLTFKTKFPHAGARTVMQDLAKIASQGNSCRPTANGIQLHDRKNKNFGMIPCAIEQEIFELFRRNVGFLDTIYAVRLFEFLIKAAIDCYTDGNKTFDIHIPGRAKQLTKALGFSSNQAITIINNLVMLLDVLKFDLPSINSRLISIADCKSNSPFSSKGGWIMTILPPLRPFKARQYHDFLTPLLKNPPLVGHTKYHAQQYLLKWRIAEEFSKQSDHLAKEGYILLKDSKWREMFYSVGLPERLLSQIHAAITSLDGYQEQTHTGNYRLREEKPQKLLERQGRERIKNSEYGKKSAEKRKAGRQSKNNKP